MSNKEATKSETWWMIFIVVAILFIVDLFIVDPVPFVDEIILMFATAGTLVGAIINSVGGR